MFKIRFYLLFEHILHLYIHGKTLLTLCRAKTEIPRKR